MAKTVLNAVNDILIKASAIDSGDALASLTDNSRQTYVDLALQVVNEVVDEMYSRGDMPKPRIMREATITLVADQRSYTLNSRMTLLRKEYDLINEANNHIITLMGEDGYFSIIRGDLDQDDTGLPSFAAISPIDGKLVMDRIPDSTVAGRVYKYRYERDLQLDDKDDTLPFSDVVYRGMVAAAAEAWKRERHQEFDAGVYMYHLGRALRALRSIPPRTNWMPASRGGNATDPMSD